MRWLGMVADAERAKAPKDPNDPRYTPPPTYYEDGSGAFVWKYLSPK